MGVADPLVVHHDDEVHSGVLARHLGERLEDLRGIGGEERLAQSERMGEGLRDRHRARPGLPVHVVPGLEYEGQYRPGGEQHHDRHLKDEYLSGDAARALSAQ